MNAQIFNIKTRPGSLFLALFIAALLLPTSVYSQSCGDEAITEARKAYDMGHFKPAISSLKTCLAAENGFSGNRQQISARRWLVKLYIALDSTDQALSSVQEILKLDDTYTPPAEDPMLFHNLVRYSKRSVQRATISSVSKSAESLYESPATVIVLTQEELMQRGYIDLEAFFSDLPGFDVSRTYGSTYSNIYQRGYRSNNTDRTIFLVNGIEENDFWGNWAYWARQYPLTHVKQVEIIYGPASTMYGANAFLGVVNVVTKSPDDFLEKDGKPVISKFPLAATADVGYGSYNTAFADLSLAGKYKDISFSATVRRFTSDLMDLSSDEVRGFDGEYPVTEFQYRPEQNDTVNYILALGGTIIDESWNDPNGYFDLIKTPDDKTVAVLNQKGAEFARQLDNQRSDSLDGKPLAFGNTLEHWYFSGEIRFSNFRAGYQFWRSEHSPGTYGTARNRATSHNGDLWAPQQSHYFLNYTKSLNRKIVLTNFMQYRLSTLEDDTRITTLKSYSNGKLKAKDLLKSRSAHWLTTYYYQASRQFRNETKLVYHGSRLNVVSGLEVRNSVIQGDYITKDSLKNGQSPAEQGNSTLDEEPGGNTFPSRDIGIYAQGTYEVFPNRLRATLGGRFDANRVRQTGGYGEVFNSRVALVYTPGKDPALNNGEAPWVFKTIYASAFKDASNREKYSVGTERKITNPKLKPEKVDNLEFSATYHQSNKWISDITFYRSWYKHAIGEVDAEEEVNGKTIKGKKNEAIGELRIYGLQANVNYQFSLTKKVSEIEHPLAQGNLFANLSFTESRNRPDEFIKAVSSIPGAIKSDTINRPNNNFQPVADISQVNINAGINLRFWHNPTNGSYRLNANLRANYIGERRSPLHISEIKRRHGEKNPIYSNEHFVFPEVFLLHGAVTWMNAGISGLNLQLAVNNILNKKYFDPGIRSADPYRIPQNTRNYMLRATFNI